MTEINIENLGNEVKKIVAEIVEIEPDRVTLEADFVEDLGMDSMQALEIMAAIEKKYSMQIPEDYLGKVVNLSNLLEIAREIIDNK